VPILWALEKVMNFSQIVPDCEWQGGWSGTGATTIRGLPANGHGMSGWGKYVLWWI